VLRCDGVLVELRRVRSKLKGQSGIVRDRASEWYRLVAVAACIKAKLVDGDFHIYYC
jgi:hypothetical protein